MTWLAVALAALVAFFAVLACCGIAARAGLALEAARVDLADAQEEMVAAREHLGVVTGQLLVTEQALAECRATLAEAGAGMTQALTALEATREQLRAQLVAWRGLDAQRARAIFGDVDLPDLATLDTWLHGEGHEPPHRERTDPAPGPVE